MFLSKLHRGQENSCLLHYLPITSLLGVSFRKAGRPENCGQDEKTIFYLKVTVALT